MYHFRNLGKEPFMLQQYQVPSVVLGPSWKLEQIMIWWIMRMFMLHTSESPEVSTKCFHSLACVILSHYQNHLYHKHSSHLSHHSSILIFDVIISLQSDCYHPPHNVTTKTSIRIFLLYNLSILSFQKCIIYRYLNILL